MTKFTLPIFVMIIFLATFTLTISAGNIDCDWFKVNCPNSNAVNTITANTTANAIEVVNTTITDKGTVLQTYGQGQQYSFLVTLPKTNGTGGIYEFALLGTYGMQAWYQDAILTNCTITDKISCTSTFILSAGTYTAIEVKNNGKWLYALKLPSTIATVNTKPITVTKKGTDNTLSTVLKIVGICVVTIGGSMYVYSIYMQKKHPEDLYK